MKNGQRKNAQTAATVLSVNAKTSCIYNYTTTAIDRQVPDFEVLDGGCQGVRPRMVGIGFTLLLRNRQGISLTPAVRPILFFRLSFKAGLYRKFLILPLWERPQ